MNFTAAPDARSDGHPMQAPATPPTGRKYRVLLVDDHPITRQGLRCVIDAQRNLEVCGEAADAGEALRLANLAPPDIAVVDIVLRPGNGIELTQQLKARHPEVFVLVMSMHEETAYAERALRAGASGYLMKQEAADKMVTALQRLLDGGLFVSPRVQERMTQRLTPKRRLGAALFPIDTLSEREREVFELIGDGYGTRQISEKLGLSPKTVDSYREHLKLKLGLHTGADLVRHAVEWGRIKEPA